MHRAILLSLVALLLAACGGAAQNRPAVVASYPANGAKLPGMMRQVRVTYDERISILNPNSVELISDGSAIPLQFFIDPQDPYSLLFEPLPGFIFLPGVTSMWLGAGLEVNSQEHYRLDDFNLYWSMGLEPSVFFAVPSPPAIHEINADDFTIRTITVTPGGRRPVAMAGSSIGTDDRMWVQLVEGAGTGLSLATYTLGDNTMALVDLTVSPGGDLVGEAPAIQLSGDGQSIYVAYRDTAAGQVRLAGVDVQTGLETGSLLLSPPASPVTRPLGLVTALDGSTVDLTVATAVGDFIVRVKTSTFTEVDLDTSSPALARSLPEGGGPIGGYSVVRVVAPRGRTTADLTITDPKTSNQTQNVSIIPGAPNVLFVTLDGRWVFEGLTNYVEDEALAIRFEDNLTSPDPRRVTADAGPGTLPATAVRSITNYPGRPRVLVLFDNSVASVLQLREGFWVQEDLDPDLDGEQGVDLSVLAPGATFATFRPPALAPSVP